MGWLAAYLEAAISMPESEAWVRARAPRLENGYISLTTKLLRSLPIKLAGTVPDRILP